MKLVLEAESIFPDQNGQAVSEGSLFLSRVTGLVALKRMDQFELKLKVPSELAECESLQLLIFPKQLAYHQLGSYICLYLSQVWTT